MLKKYKNILENKYMGIMAFVAVLGAPIADAIGNENGFWFFWVVLFSFIIIAVYDESKKNKLFQLDSVYIPLIIKVHEAPSIEFTYKNLLKEIEKTYQLEDYEQNVKNYLDFDLHSMSYEYKGSIYDYEQLIDFIRTIKNDMKKLEKKLGTRVQYHIAYAKRPSVGFLIGTMFRTDGICVYQNNDAQNIFCKVLDIKDRSYKESENSFEKYTIKKEISSKDYNDSVLIIINSSSHYVNENASALKNYTNKIVMTLNSNKTIPYDEDWVGHVKEIYSIIDLYRLQYNHVIIAHSMPESLSLVVGMAIETYWNIDITQYNSQTQDYDTLYTMNQIKYFS